MKTRITSIIAFAVLALSGTAALADTRVTASAVQVRTGPSFTNQVMETIPAGSYLDVVGCTEWCKIRYRGGMEGWVYGAQISNAQSPREQVYEPVQYGWYEIPTIGTVVTVYSDRDRFYYNDRGQRHFIDRRWVQRERPHHQHDRRDDWRDDRRDDSRNWVR